MATLQRSVDTFRRTGSSGLVWDNSFCSTAHHSNDGGGGVDTMSYRELRHSHSVGCASSNSSNNSSSSFAGIHAAYRHRPSKSMLTPIAEPPKVTAIGLFGLLRKPAKVAKKSGKAKQSKQI